MLTELIIDKYSVKTTGADGGHIYVSTEIEYKGKLRKLTVLFIENPDEMELKKGSELKIKGELKNEGEKYDLIMNNATLEK